MDPHQQLPNELQKISQVERNDFAKYLYIL